MQPIYMRMSYYREKKLKKKWHVLEANLKTIKKTLI